MRHAGSGRKLQYVIFRPLRVVVQRNAPLQKDIAGMVGDLDQLLIETTDLSEKDAASIRIGAAARVSFDALPGVTVTGTVTRIAPRSVKTTGVNYTVTIELDEMPAGLRWGMTALVEIVR